MLSKILSFGLLGLGGYPVVVETDISSGMPIYETVGLPGAAVRESKERVRSAIKNSEFEYPQKRITINLAPADTKKSGAIYDLPIAMGILCASEQVNPPGEDCVLLGELSLDGQLRSVAGALPMAISASMAIAQKRDVFAVSGMSRMSELPNNLIKQGAVPVTCAGDILAYYGKITVNSLDNNETTDEQIKNQLDFLQSHIYNLLLKGDISVELIAAGSEHPQSEINAALTMMEMSGLIKRLPGGKYGI